MSETTKGYPTSRNGVLSRRAAIKRVASTSAGVVIGWMAVVDRNADAQGILAKAAVDYQDSPKGNENCLNCSQFVPGATQKAVGTCKIVAGRISPDGWCNVWAAKS